MNPRDQTNYPEQVQPEKVACRSESAIYQLSHTKESCRRILETILSSSFRLRYSMPPSISRSLSVKPWNSELRPTVTWRESCGRPAGRKVTSGRGCVCSSVRVGPRTSTEEAALSRERAEAMPRPSERYALRRDRPPDEGWLTGLITSMSSSRRRCERQTNKPLKEFF